MNAMGAKVIRFAAAMLFAFAAFGQATAEQTVDRVFRFSPAQSDQTVKDILATLAAATSTTAAPCSQPCASHGWIVVVAFHDHVAARAEFALLAQGKRRAGRGIDNLNLGIGQRFSHRGDAEFQGIMDGASCPIETARRCPSEKSPPPASISSHEAVPSHTTCSSGRASPLRRPRGDL